MNALQLPSCQVLMSMYHFIALHAVGVVSDEIISSLPMTNSIDKSTFVRVV